MSSSIERVIQRMESMTREERYATVKLSDVKTWDHGFALYWEGIMGFGEFSVWQDSEKTLNFENEGMSKEFALMLFSRLVDRLYSNDESFI